MTPTPDGPRDGAAAGADGWRDLLPRTLSALVLIPAGLGVALAGGPWLAGAAGAAVLAMSYEWARMSEPEDLIPAFLIALVGSLGAVMFASWGAFVEALGWMAAMGAFSAVRRRSLGGVLDSFGGVVYVSSGPIAFLWLREQEVGGAAAIISLFLIIWAADSAAYFSGRIIGGPKLLPRLSPNKTWAGLGAGVVAGGGAGAVCGLVFGGAVTVWMGLGAILALVGLGGDLLESLLKRRFGVKDASRLIPGHGGVLDRLDGLIAATWVAAGWLLIAPGSLASLIGRP